MPEPVSTDLDGDPAWVHVCEREDYWMVALAVAMTTTCDQGEEHTAVLTQNLNASETRKLAAALLNAADELDEMDQS